MKILVLGATGFIGRNMVEHFAALGHEVHGVFNKRQPYDGPVWREHDLCEPFDFSGYDVVIQAAATTSGSKDIINTPAIHVTDNVVMNALIFRAAVEAKVKHVIFFSCSTMFSAGHVTEDSPLDIHPKYFGVAHTKLYNEKMCEFYAGIGETKFTVIRHSNCYGPYDKYDLEKSHFFGATITKVMQARKPRPDMNANEALLRYKDEAKIIIWGTGEEARDLLHVDDLCAFVAAAIDKQTYKFKLYNAGYGIAFKVRDVVQMIIDASGKQLNIAHDLTAPTIPTSLSMDCTKAKQELGWWPKVTLPDGIKRTIEWYKGIA